MVQLCNWFKSQPGYLYSKQELLLRLLGSQLSGCLLTNAAEFCRYADTFEVFTLPVCTIAG